MTITEWLLELGGVATRGTLVQVASREQLERAITAGDVVRIGRGRYALPTVDEALRLAVALGGAVSHASAAVRHGWPVKSVPSKPHVTVSRGRKLDPALTRQVHVHFAELRPDQVDGHVSTEEVTIAACLRQLQFDEALAIADSALREGFGANSLARIADEARGPGSPKMRRVAAEASELAANPFESALRAIALDVPGLRVEPQVEISVRGHRFRPDLVDERLRIVAEAESFEWHGGREQLTGDARRYNLLVVDGWIVLRFAWEDVMHDPDFVRDIFVAVVALAELLNEVGARRGRAA